MTQPDYDWSILYRGDLSSCNYSCVYCPFAKTRNTREELAKDKLQLFRFVDWVEAREDRSIGILFTPWGEAAIRKGYQKAITRLSHIQHVKRVAIQTNLSFEPTWLGACDLKTVALWTTFHPSQTSLDAFVSKANTLVSMGVRFSVGAVGLREDLEVIESLRRSLPEEVYLWINAYKRTEHYYSEEDIQHISSIDPLFRYNTRYHHSLNESCQAGFRTFSVNGQGDVSRCHFIKDKIGNIYDDMIDDVLNPTPCTNTQCGCYIGYAHMDRLELAGRYTHGLLERIPSDRVWIDDAEKIKARREVLAEMGEHSGTMKNNY